MQPHRIIASEAGQRFSPAHGSIRMFPRNRGSLVGHVISFALGGLAGVAVALLHMASL